MKSVSEGAGMELSELRTPYSNIAASRACTSHFKSCFLQEVVLDCPSTSCVFYYTM